MDAPLRVPVRKRRLCFALEHLGLAIHATPKAAATSVRHACLATLGISAAPQADGQEEAARFLHPIEHVRGRLFVAALVRHPVDRLISAWVDKAMGPGRLPRGLAAAGVTKGMGFADFVKAACRAIDPHVALQADLLMPKGVISFDMLLRYERLEEDWARLCRLYPALPGLVRSNQTPGDLRRIAEADAGALRSARRLVRPDLEAFGYG